MLTTYQFIYSWGTPGLVGTLGVTVKDTAGNELIPRTTSGIQDITNGDYLISIPNWDVSWRVVIELDDGVNMVVDVHSLSIGINPNSNTSITAGITSLSGPRDADIYFGTRLGGDNWILISDDSEKQKALNDATRIINRFAYVGCKTLPTQPNEWPRKGICGTDLNTIPADVLNAQYEIAYALKVDGIDIQMEQNRANVTSRRFAGVATTYSDKQPLPDYILWGVPSWLAWTLLLPFIDLNRSEDIRLNRVT